MSATPDSQLPVVECAGCGVCCFHMGYPAFRLPREPMTDADIDADPLLQRKMARDPRLREELRRGESGESHWHRLPEPLKSEWLAFVEQYSPPAYDGTMESLDGPCFWLDPQTRQCRHHEFRPNVCRDFATGSRECLDWRRQYLDQIEGQPFC